MRDKKNRADSIIKKFDPKFRHRWETYDEKLVSLLNESGNWLDCGCGDNGIIEEFAHLANFAIGIDLETPQINKNRFVKSDINHLPFENDNFDLVTLRFVVEHLPDRIESFSDIFRVMKPGGKLLLLTTNTLCPFIFIPRLLPFPLKNWLITKIFKVQEKDVFPTFHKLNRLGQFQKGISGFKLKELVFISDLNYTRKLIFFIYLIWHLITMPKIFNKFRTNILAVFEKEIHSL